MIKVSVIIPIYNDEEFLRPCLESVVQQSLKDIEIICINDGSTDNTGMIVEEYQKDWNNIVVYTQENQGVSCARNKGIQLARGEYIAFMDGDDYYPGYDVLECLYKTAKRENVKICGGSYIQDRKGTIKRKFTGINELRYFKNNQKMSFMEYAYPMAFTRFIYCTEMLRSEDIEFPPVRFFEDPPFLNMAMIKAGDFYAISKEVYCHRKLIHKRAWDYRDCINGLKVIKEMLFQAQIHHMVKLQINCMKVFKNKFIVHILPYYFFHRAEYVKLLKEIDACLMPELKLQLSEADRYFTEDWINVFSDEAEKEYMHFKGSIKKCSGIVLYGAGEVGDYILKLIMSDCPQKLLGVAVSNLAERQQYLANIAVTDIESWDGYQEDTMFIIATNGYQKEMIDVLNKMGVKNIYFPEYIKLSCYCRIKECKQEIF